MQTKNISKKKVYWLSVAIVGAVVGIALQIAHASWTGPTQTAPQGDFGAPITTGGGVQTRTGTLIVGSGGNDLVLGQRANLVVPNGGQICLNGICIKDWTQAGPLTYKPGSQLFTDAGSHQFTVPTGVTVLHAEIWGAGGGGSVGLNTFNYNHSNRLVTGGSGGGSGGWVYADIPVNPGDELNFWIGSGGSGGSNLGRNSETNTTQDYGWSGNTSYVYNLASPNNLIMIAGGGNGGHDHDSQYTSGGENGIAFCVAGDNSAGGTASSSVSGALTAAGNAAINCGNLDEDNRPGGAAIKSSKTNQAYGAGGNGRYWGTDDAPQWSCTSTTYAPYYTNQWGESQQGWYYDSNYILQCDVNGNVTAGPTAASIGSTDLSGPKLTYDSNGNTVLSCIQTSCTPAAPIPGIVATSNNGSNGAAYITW